MKKLVLITLLCISYSSILHSSEWIVRDAEIMGTTIHTEVWHENEQLARDVAGLVLDTMNEVNQRMSPYIESSELSVINTKAATEVMPISDQLYSVIDRFITQILVKVHLILPLRVWVTYMIIVKKFALLNLIFNSNWRE